MHSPRRSVISRSGMLRGQESRKARARHIAVAPSTPIQRAISASATLRGPGASAVRLAASSKFSRQR